MEIKYEVNKIHTDEFGRVSGVFAAYKEVGITSHDLVYKFRRYFSTQKVGHAGALDPFASGLVIILVGKALKLSDSFLNLDKEYKAELLFGVSTDSGDVEGKVIKSSSSDSNYIKENIENKLNSFTPEYIQCVPVFSSVKVQGDKLRELARKYESFNIEVENSEKIINFYKNNEIIKKVKLPSKTVQINNINLIALKSFSKDDLIKHISSFKQNHIEDFEKIKYLDFDLAIISLSCSKGTYIRQFAEDVGEALNNLPAMLINLERVRIGNYNIDNTFKFN